jgi:hypothetical protein
MRDRSSLRARDHTRPEVREALADVLARPGWLLVRGGHWGFLVCEPGCHRIAVSGTPQNAGAHARRILREADMCPLPDADPRSRRRQVGRAD